MGRSPTLVDVPKPGFLHPLFLLFQDFIFAARATGVLGCVGGAAAALCRFFVLQTRTLGTLDVA